MSEQQAKYRKNGRYPEKGLEEASLSNYVFGKVQPQAVPLEEAVLGALMLDRDAMIIVMDILRPESFYLEAHQVIYRAILRLFERANPIDILTVTEELRKSGDLEKAGGGYYIVELSHRVASAANIEYHARIIAQKHLMRELIRVSTTTIRDAYEETTEVFALLDWHETQILTARNLRGEGMKKLNDLTMQVLQSAEAAVLARNDGKTVGVPSGISDLDKETGGFRNSDLTVIAGRPGMGKSALLNTIVLSAAKAGFGVGVFSLEMSAEQLVLRMVSAESEIDSRRISAGTLTDADFQNLTSPIERINNLPVHIDDTPGLNILELRARARRMSMMHDVKIILIDYLQLMQAAEKSGNREQQVSEISRGLKHLAKELNVPVIALAQLSRAVEIRGGSKRPQLSDLRESGAIEQDADNVFFIYRPEYYGITENEHGEHVEGYTEFNVAKNRHGRAGQTVTALARYVAQHTIFKSYDEPASNQFPIKHTNSLPVFDRNENLPF